MMWSFQPDSPIYLQLKEQIKRSIISGYYPPKGKLPAVRDIAIDAAVNPNTVQKALSELEREGLLYSQRTNGRYVTEDAALIEQIKNELAFELINTFLENMNEIGYSPQKVVKLIEEKMGEAN